MVASVKCLRWLSIRFEVSQPSAWDFRTTWGRLSGLSRDFIRSLPFLIVLRASGSIQLALTIAGGTGLVGITFRDITENSWPAHS